MSDQAGGVSAFNDQLGPRWWKCPTHGPAKATAWGCPECVREMRTERNGLMQTLRDEMDENLRLRELGGAMPDENITAMTERLIRERDSLRESCIPSGWALEYGVAGFDETRWVCIRNLQTQCGQDFYEDRDPLIFGFLAAMLPKGPNV